MTLVVGILDQDNQTWLAGDSFCGDSEVIDYCSDPKILKIKSVGFGLCGELRSELVVTNSLKKLISKEKTVTKQWIKEELPNLLFEDIKNDGVLRTDNGVVSLNSSGYILTFKGSLYYLEESLAIWSPKFPYVAIGAGRNMALSLLAYTSKNKSLQKYPEKTLRSIFEAVALHSHYVKPPFTIERM